MSLPEATAPADFRALFEAAPGWLIAVRPEDNFLVAAASDAYLLATSKTRGETLGRPLFDVFTAEPGTPAAESLARLGRTLRAVRERHAAEILPAHRYDLPRPADAGGGMEERYWQTTVWPVPARAEDGPMRFLLCRTEDVTAQVRSSEEMADVRARLEATLEAAEIGTWICDLDGDRVYADRNMARLFHVSEADARGGRIETYLQSIHPDDQPRVARAIAQAEEGKRFEVECRLRQPDGSYRWVSERGWVERDPATGKRRFPGVVVDITERRQAQEALEEKSERLRMAVESAQLGTWDFNPATGDLQWSDAHGTMFGLQPGTPVSYDLFLRSIHPEDREGVAEAIRRVLAPGGDGRFAMEFRVVGLDDGQERWIASQGRAFFNPAGQAERFIGTTFDITLRKRAEEAAARRSEQMQRLAAASARLNAAHDVASVLGIVAAEARRLIGARHAHTTALPAGHPRGHARPVSASSSEGNVPPAPGAEHESLSVPMLGHGGQPIGVLELLDKEIGAFTGDDDAMLSQLAQIAAGAIENARLYEELRANDKRKDEFLAMLAHELRNPLAAIRNAVALGSDGAEAEEVAWSLEVIGRQTHNLSRLIDDLLDVSRITQGMVRLRKELLDAAAILERAVNAVRGLVAERRHTLRLDAPPEALALEADPARLEQMLVNLLVNAAKYTDKGGEISLGARQENGHIVFRVRDNGVGIPPEKLPQMFELFAQGSRSLARSEGGLGIGLTVVRSLAELHGGTVHATSRGVGEGTEFVVRLPASPLPQEQARGAREKAAAALTTPPPRGRALVVDDNVDSACGMARILKRRGYEVQVAYDGPSAVEAALARPPDFLFLDIGLPGMNGYEVARRLRQEPGLADAVLVAVSGYGEEGDRRRSREAGFDQHLVKPVDPEVLLKLMRK